SSVTGRMGGAVTGMRWWMLSHAARAHLMLIIVCMASNERTQSPSSATNVSDPERWLSVVAGTALAAYGLKSRNASGLTLAGLGSALVWRGATGHCTVYETLGISTATDDGS